MNQSKKPPRSGLPGGGHALMDKEALMKPIVFPNHQRQFKIFTVLFSAAVTYYMVFHYDFGDKRHCFTWLREVKEEKERAFFSIAPDDRELQRVREKSHDNQTPKETR